MNEQNTGKETGCFTCQAYFECKHNIQNGILQIKEDCKYFTPISKEISGGNSS